MVRKQIERLGPAAAELVPDLLDSMRGRYLREEVTWPIQFTIGEPAIPYVAAALESSDPLQRRAAAMVLAHWPEGAKGVGIPALVKSLETEDDELKVHIARSLGNLGTEAEAAIAGLRAAQKDASEKARKELEAAVTRIRYARLR